MASYDHTKERELWAWLKKGAKALTVPHHIHRIEDLTKSGTPDVEGCIGGSAFWAELKVATEQRTRGTIRISTTAHQVYFALQRSRAGGRSWYLIRVGTYPSWEHYLVPGMLAEQLLDKPIPLLHLVSMSPVPPNASAVQLLLAAAQA